MRILLIAVSLSVLLAGCAGRSTFSGGYISDTDYYDPAPDGCRVGEITVVDPRDEPEVVGQRSMEQSERSKPILYDGDMAAFVREAVVAVFEGSEVEIGQGGSTLEVTIDRLELKEEVNVGAAYFGQIRLDVVLRGGRGRSCWTGTVAGSAENGGAAGSSANYRETISHALERALKKLFADRAFMDALQNCS